MAITFDKVTKVILVESPATEVSIQDLVNAIRDFEDEWYGMDEASLTNAYGKQDLGGGVQVGITLELINNWRVQFEARPDWITCYVRGGNIVAVNDYGNDPIKPSDYVNVVITQSTSASLIEGADPAEIADAVWDESAIGHLTAGTFGALVDFLSGIEGGQWKIENNQMIFYKSDNTTEIARFNLYDAAGQPAMKNVMERERA